MFWMVQSPGLCSADQKNFQGEATLDSAVHLPTLGPLSNLEHARALGWHPSQGSTKPKPEHPSQGSPRWPCRQDQLRPAAKPSVQGTVWAARPVWEVTACRPESWTGDVCHRGLGQWLPSARWTGLFFLVASMIWCLLTLALGPGCCPSLNCIFSSLAGSEADEAGRIAQAVPGLRRCTYVQGCAQSWDAYLWILLRCIFYFFTHRKRYNCWSALKMYLTRAFFPKPTLLVTARGGAVFWNCSSQVTKAPALCVHLCRGYCTVRKEKRPSEGGENFQSLNLSTLIYCVIFFFLQLWHASDQLHRSHRLKSISCLHSLTSFFLDIPSNGFHTEIPLCHDQKLWYYVS